MQLNVNDLKIGQGIFVFDKNPQEPLIYQVDITEINQLEPDVYKLARNVYIDITECKLFNTLTECIDIIRSIDHISNFDNTSFTWYMEYIKDAIDNKIPVYVIRESGGVKFIDESYISYIKYDDTWKLGTKSINHYYKTCHKASVSLGLRIYFNKENAIRKLNSLTGDKNEILSKIN